MCLTIVNKKGKKPKGKPRPYIAEKKMVVYKILEKGSMSPFQQFRWQRGYNYYEDKPLEVTSPYYVGCGYMVDRGLHAFQTLQDAKDYKELVLFGSIVKFVEMIIPKGAKYFLGERGDIVSDKLNFPL